MEIKFFSDKPYLLQEGTKTPITRISNISIGNVEGDNLSGNVELVIDDKLEQIDVVMTKKQCNILRNLLS